jgi:hypothetical protein
MMKKFCVFLLLLGLLIYQKADAFLIGSCPVDGKTLTGSFNGMTYQTSSIDCDDYGVCKTMLMWTTDNLSYQISNLTFNCSGSSFLIDTVRCFFNANTYNLTCVLANDNDMMNFTANGQTYSYPKTTPMVLFMVR